MQTHAEIARKITPCDCNGDESIPHKPGQDKPEDYVCPSHFQIEIEWALAWVRRKALEEARDASCKWCREGNTDFAGHYHLVERLVNSVLCESAAIRALIMETQ